MQAPASSAERPAICAKRVFMARMPWLAPKRTMPSSTHSSTFWSSAWERLWRLRLRRFDRAGAREALERAGYNSDSHGGLIGGYAGLEMSTYLHNVFSQPDLFEKSRQVVGIEWVEIEGGISVNPAVRRDVGGDHRRHARQRSDGHQLHVPFGPPRQARGDHRVGS